MLAVAGCCLSAGVTKLQKMVDKAENALMTVVHHVNDTRNALGDVKDKVMEALDPVFGTSQPDRVAVR